MDEVLRLLRSQQVSLMQRWPIARLSVFGSVARGEAQEQSDVDLLIEFRSSVGWEFFDLAQELEKILGKPVDLIPKVGLKARYWERIAPEVVEVFHA